MVTANIVADILTDPADAPVVRAAVDMLVEDVQMVTSRQLNVVTAPCPGKPVIIAGTLGRSKYIDLLVRQKKINTKDIREQWESFVLQTVKRPVSGVSEALVIAGSDPRGTAYGILEISRLMGVSPWVWWADVRPAPLQEVYISRGKTVSGSPSVKYRGLFINDEDHGLFPWASRHIDCDRKNIGPNTYTKVMQLLLRLRANLLWPAMHSCSEAFWANKQNIEVARKYDIVLGSSHCEQMLRDNEWEWNRFGGDGNRNWRWKENRDMVARYWAERVGESRGIDAIYTLGMRGVHDTGINGYATTEDKVAGLTDIIRYQRQLLADSIGSGNPTRVPQLFIPYKEVLDAYNGGLKVPDDVTICWVDDNHGYMRQLPSPEEQQRSGGNALYYHLSYLGTPVPWCWLSSVSPALMSFELSKAYDQQVRQMWVINVGDIKPQEAEFEFSMDMAWNVNSWQPEKAWQWTRQWAARTFGESYADRIAEIKNIYYRLAAGGKPEHIYAVPYTIDEQNHRIADFERITSMVETLKPEIPARLHDAYYELIEFPVLAAAYMNKKVFRDQQAIRYAKAGYRDEALSAERDAKQAYGTVLQLVDTYNQSIAQGKWDGIMEYLPWGHRPARKAPTEIIDSICPKRIPLIQPSETVIPGNALVASRGAVTVMKGLGTSGVAVTVWPMDMTHYEELSADTAPFVEYNIPVEPGNYEIEARCLCTFPINNGYDLRVAFSIDGGKPQTISVKTKAMEHVGNDWHKTVLAGYSPAVIRYQSDTKRDLHVRIYLLDPGIVINDLKVKACDFVSSYASQTLSAYMVQGDSQVTLDFHAPQRGWLDQLQLTLPKSLWAKADAATVDIIGKVSRPLLQYATKDNGKLIFRNLDLRPDNGVDVRIVFPDVNIQVGEGFDVVWQMSTPSLPDSVQGKAYVVHNPTQVYSASAILTQRPAIRRQRFDARSLGLKGDGKTDDTEPLNMAILKLYEEGGGEIDFRDGTFCIRTAHLKSHVWLHIAADATIKALPGMDEPEETWFEDISHNAGNNSLDETPYDPYGNYMTKQDVGHSFSRNCMFYAQREEDIRIYGQGRLTGDGVIDTGNGVMNNPAGLRADKMFTFKLCRDIEVGGEGCLPDMWYDKNADEPAYLLPDGSLSTVENRKMLDVDQAGHFVILATGTDNIRVHDIYCGRASTNRARDIFDFMACSNVHVTNIYSTVNGDDIVKLGSDCSLGFTRKSSGTYVRNIVGDTNCNLFQIGSETADDITDVYVDNILVLATNKAGFSISSNDGGRVARVFLNSGKTGSLHHRSEMHRTRTPLFLSISNRGRVVGTTVKPYHFRFNKGDELRHELLVTNRNIGYVEDIDLRHIDCDEVYAGSCYYNKIRWKSFDGTQPESTPIIAGFKVPESEMVEGGLDFCLPDGRMTSYIERVRLEDWHITVKGGHPATDAQLLCPEIGVGKFNIRDLKVQPSYGLWARHVRGLSLIDVTFHTEQPDGRPDVILDDVIK